MCLAVPGQITSVEHHGDSRIGHIRFGGITRQAYLDFVPEATLGDYVLVHVGFAIGKVDAAEALRISSCSIKYLDEFRDPRIAHPLAARIARNVSRPW